MKTPAVFLFCLTTGIVAAAQPWQPQNIPAAVVRDALESDTVLDEIPCEWRTTLRQIFLPVAQECATPREAVLKIAAGMTERTGVYYSPNRRKADMNPQEALAEKKVSCTGQSILLVCALRSVGIPARAVGVGTWGHIRGNHTWCEAWFDGGWQMIEFNERDFNTPWVMENIGMLNTNRPEQRIYAASGTGSATFPNVWNLRCNLPAEDVTERYAELSRRWYAANGLPENLRRIMLDIQPRTEEIRTVYLETEDGQVLAHAPLPTLSDDMRKLTSLNLPKDGQYYLRISDGGERLPLPPSDAPVQVLRLFSRHEDGR